TEFTLEAAVEATPVPTNPKRFQPNPRFNAALQAFIAAESTVPATPGYGAVGNGRVPIRDANPVFGDPNNPTATAYSDGSVSGNYVNYFTGSATIVGGNTLNARNRIAGDFDGDGDRDIDDIAGLMAAIDDPAAYA